MNNRLTKMMIPIPPSLHWVQCTGTSRNPFWCYTSRLLIDSTTQDQQLLIRSLKAGKIVYLEESRMEVQALPLSPKDQKRFGHLATFERGDFKLTAFRGDLAIYSDAERDFYSMSEMAERGFLPKPSVPIDPLNKPIYQGTTLVDVFIPVRSGPTSFYFSANGPF